MTPGGNILVTGGAGFIGSHACLALSEAGYRPVVMDNLSTGHADAVLDAPLLQADLRDTPAVVAALKDHRIVAIMHFAASAYVGESMSEPDAYYDNNVGGIVSLLQAARQAGVRRLVFSSSCATYGTPEHLPITEETAQRPINPYGRTKLMGEQILADHAAAYGLRFAVLRYFNAAGADPRGRLRERHDPETHLVPLALMAAAGTGPALRVFGNDYPTPDGTCIRDYIHVSDLARAHVQALGHLMADRQSITLNLGTGQGHSVLEIIREVEDQFAIRVPHSFEPRRAGDPAALIADVSRAREVLGFEAEFRSLRRIIADAAPSFGLRRHETV